MLVHEEGGVQPLQHLAGVAEVGVGQRLRPQHVQGRNREQRGAHAVAAHIQQIDGKMVVVEPMIPKRIAASSSLPDNGIARSHLPN